MAEDIGQAKTEAATPRRREEARNKGQVPLSTDLTGGLMLLAGVMVLWFWGSTVAESLLRTTRQQLLSLGHQDLSIGQIQSVAMNLFAAAAAMLAPLAAVLVGGGMLVGALQAGFHVTFQPLQADWARMSPIKGWSRAFSLRSLVRGAMTILKASAAGLLVWWIVAGRAGDIRTAGLSTLSSAAAQGWTLALQLGLAIGAAWLLLGVFDYLIERYRHEQQLRMSRREVREEQREHEGDPLIKARVKKLQREAAQRRRLNDVPSATLVLTNPQHIAVALRYDRASMAAPRVVAKGTDLWARRIVEIARKHGVPVLERKPLARALYASVRAGDEIPSSFYEAVAQILAYLYGLKSAR